MSQEKVDRYKKEKKNRGKVMKRRKIRKTLITVIVTLLLAAGLGALIGIPLGKKIYRDQKKREKAKSIISVAEYESWFNYLWVDKYSDVFVGMDFESNTDDATVGDATAGEAE